MDGQEWVAGQVVAFLDKEGGKHDKAVVVSTAQMYASVWNQAGLALKGYEEPKEEGE